MIKVDKRNAVICLHETGMSIRKIAQQLKMDRHTIRSILKNGTINLNYSRKTQIQIDLDLLKKLHQECEGYVQRVHEKLTEEHGLKIAYSTLTRKIKEMGVNEIKNQRCGQVPDTPGQEMQNDTSDYKILIGNQKMKLIGAVLYLRYSKLKYLKFYPNFNRFQMKCFFHEALTYWKYSADQCIIDNTHLAVLHGTGPNAVFVPEMIAFAEQFQFKWLAHRIRHSNRKAGNERSFFSIETNFLKGRTFSSIEDLNQQAFMWATERNAHRPQSKTRLIPSELFENEKPFLNKLSPYIQPPYQNHERDVDQYGYSSFNANFYWIPGVSLEKVTLLQYANMIKIYRKHSLLLEYLLPPFGIRNKKFKPEGIPDIPYEPKGRVQITHDEEQKLRSISDCLNQYLNFIDLQKLSPIKKNKLIRRIYDLYQKLSSHFLTQTIQRAFKYKVTDADQVERIASQLVQMESYDPPFIDDYDENIENRDSYKEGKLTDVADLESYEALLDQKKEEESSG